MKKRTRLLLAFAMVLFCQFAYAQLVFKGCIVAEGNNYGAPGNLVKMAHYFPVDKHYVYFDSIPGDFTNEVLCDGANTYIHVGNINSTKDSIYRYDSKCHTRLNAAQIKGFQKMKTTATKLIASKGFGADSNYIEILDKTSLVKLATITEVDQMCNGIAINGSIAYVAVNGSWPSYTDSGTVAMIDLNTNSFIGYIKLDTNAKVVNNVYSKGTKLWCECDFDKIVEYDLISNTFVIYSLGIFQNTVGLYGDDIAISTFTGITSWNVLTHAMLTANSYIGDVSEFRLHPFNSNVHYVIYNDYVNNIGSFVYSLPQTNRLDSFTIGIASMLDAYVDSNVSPTTTNYNVRLLADQDTTFTLTYSDLDACERLIPQIVSGPQRIGATAVLDVFGNLHYTPSIGLVADDTLVISISDISGAFVYSTIYIHVYDLLNIEKGNNINFDFYPNPSDNQLFLQIDSKETYNLELIDMLGNSVYSSSLTHQNPILDISAYQKGLYIIKLSDTNGNSISKKLIKN